MPDSNHSTSTTPLSDRVTRLMDRAYNEKELLFADRNYPTPFAMELVQYYSPNQNNLKPSGVSVEFGCGNGQDAYHLARRIGKVIAYELHPTARKNTIQRFAEGFGMPETDLSDRLDLRRNYYDIKNLPDNSVDIGHAVSSLHYLSPEELLRFLKTFGTKLKKGGAVGIALKTPVSSWPEEFRTEGRNADVEYDLSAIISHRNGMPLIVSGYNFALSDDPKKPTEEITRVFYTEEQLKLLFEEAELSLLKSETVPFPNYDRNGKTEYFAWVIGTPSNYKAKK